MNDFPDRKATYTVNWKRDERQENWIAREVKGDSLMAFLDICDALGYIVGTIKDKATA